MSDRIDSNESEGAFNDFVQERLEDMVETILNSGGLDTRGSEVIVELDDIQPPSFSYGEPGGGGGGKGNGPGGDPGKISFGLPFNQLMELMARKLGLPDLSKQGQGRIKEVSYEFKTFGTTGVILDKKRTFRRALRSSVGMGVYDPENGKYEVSIRRRDKRFKLPERVEKPRFKAVVFYMGDISYSTWGERLELEKRLVGFIHHWLDYNYGEHNVEHRFFVHDAEAYEVQAEQFYKVSNAGGTRASIVFDLVSQVAFNEYDPESTNFYGFYFGDGELFDDDAREITEILAERMRPVFNRVGIVEVKPSRASHLNKMVGEVFSNDRVVRLASLREKSQTIDVIKLLFGGAGAEH
jgi:uncharacterized sporulation protein YeaH/YhbH (DUF444 family)